MIDWQGEDLSPNEDGGIIRTQISAGEGYTSPNEGSQVDGRLYIVKDSNRLFCGLKIYLLTAIFLQFIWLENMRIESMRIEM